MTSPPLDGIGAILFATAGALREAAKNGTKKLEHARTILDGLMMEKREGP